MMVTLLSFNMIVDGKSKSMTGNFELFAKENKGMFRMGAVDCN
jgi:hypothetical protein